MPNKYLTSLVLLIIVVTHIQAQTYFHPDRHSTNSFDGWVSCTATINPNAARGISHWTMYDLGQEYDLLLSHIWNINDPDNLDAGIKDMVIDYSSDGTNWTELGVFTLEQSDGSLYYQGIEGPNFNNTSTRYLLLTAIDNYGGACYGFSEIKIDVNESILPLTVTAFDIKCIDDNMNQISWEIEKNQVDDKIELERSENATYWTSIYTESYNQLGSKESGNQFSDAAEKSYYYRLKSTDKDGIVNYSRMITSECSSFNSGLTISPNPAEDKCLISFDSKDVNTYNFLLYNNIGTLIKSEHHNIQNDKTSFLINVNDYIPGEYFIHIHTGGKSLVKKMIVL